MKELLKKINEIVPKELVVIDLYENKSKVIIIVDGSKPVDLNATASLAKKIRNSELLDSFYPKGYQLEVSSPGIDSPLVHPIQYEKNIGRDIVVKEFENSNAIIAKLTNVSEGGFDVVSEGGNQTSYQYDQIKSAIVKTKF
tara:strand:- start:1265 stop:1687 length:423 start_codon:yes stop_codon:yes gene_type:complete